MTHFLDILEQGDFCSLVFLIVVLTFLGAKMVERYPGVQAWGLRLAVGAFMGYGVYAGVKWTPVSAEGWVWVVLRGLVAAGLVLGLAWVLLPVMVFLWRFGVVGPWKKARRLVPKKKEARNDDRRARIEAEQRARDREVKEAAARLANEAEKVEKAEAERRRIDARADAELAYSHYAPKIGKRFTREQYQDYQEKFMGDKHSPEDVERRCKELIATFQKHLEDEEPPEEKKTLVELTVWFQEQKSIIEGLPLDDASKDVHLVELNARYSELCTRLLEEIGP